MKELVSNTYWFYTKMSPTLQIKSLERMSEILLSVRSPQIMQLARTLTLQLLSGIISVKDKQADYEFGCWLDGVTTETLAEFVSCLQEASHLRLFNSGFARAWQRAQLTSSVPFLPASPLLVFALRKQPSTGPFGLLTCQVAARCLLYQENPLPLAVLIHDANQTADPQDRSEHLERLAEYCNSLIKFEEFSGDQMNNLFTCAWRSLFSEEWGSIFAANAMTAIADQQTACDTLVRNLTHLITVTSGTQVGRQYVELLQKIAPLAFAVSLKYVCCICAVSLSPFC